jgi:hypothetical protein
MLIAVPLLAAGPALAQQGGSAGTADTAKHDDHERDRDFQLGLGVGLVEPEVDTEIYYSAAFRFRIDRYGDQPVWDGDYYRGRPPADTGIRGYLEPEVGYWSRSDGGDEESDLLVGLNLIGVVPTRGADFFLGVGFGLHFADTKLTDLGGQRIDESDENLGGNLQVGVDVNVSEKVALFGTGRLDIVEGNRNERQTKVFVGLRFKL